MTQKKDKSSMVIEFERKERANLKMIQARLELIGIDKTLSEIASDCLATGIYQKLKETITNGES